MKFEELGLSPPLLAAIRASGYARPTPIQTQAIPHILAGKDVLGSAQTGTGKTAAFALPIIQRLTESSSKHNSLLGPRALVLCPTRELAQQIFESFQTYDGTKKQRIAVVFGGVAQGAQARALRKGLEVLVATPGRLLDLMQQGLAGVGAVEVLVLDEADRMLDMGFLPDIKRILSRVPKVRQTLMFSATMPPAMEHLAHTILHEPVHVQVARVSSAATTVEHWVHFVEKWDKPALLARLLAETEATRSLIFTKTKRGADRLVRELERRGVDAVALHGDKTQGTRTRVLESFRNGKTPVLVATDIAARGLDIDEISHVYNYDVPPEAETYVHRVGRSGRAEATGTAISLCGIDERADLRAIERLVGAALRRADGSPAPAGEITPGYAQSSSAAPGSPAPAAPPPGSPSRWKKPRLRRGSW